MSKSYGVDDFTIVALLGKGKQGSKIYLVKDKGNKQIYALKTIRKSRVQEKNKAHYVFSERSILIEVRATYNLALPSEFDLNDRLIPELKKTILSS